MKKQTAVQQINAAIVAANGTRKTRLITMDDVCQAIAEARRDGYGYVTGGHVANAYNYPAFTSVIFAAKRTDGGVAIAIDEINAKRGSSARPQYIAKWVPDTAARSLPKMHNWADLVGTGYTCVETIYRRPDGTTIDHTVTDTVPGIVLPARKCREMVNEYLVRTGKKQGAVKIAKPAATVTLADSLAAGNCGAESRRIVSQYFAGRTEATAKELIAVVQANEPHLLRFALRAVEYAQARA